MVLSKAIVTEMGMAGDQLRRSVAPRPRAMESVLLRLASAGPCSAELERRVFDLERHTEVFASNATLDGKEASTQFLLSGWACRLRVLSDGRRQIFDLILPGEGIGLSALATSSAHVSIMALTPIRLADAKPLLHAAVHDACPELAAAVAHQANAEVGRMLNQIVRLGQLTAAERLAHLLVDLHRRLEVIGEAAGGLFTMPITQETLADLLGLSVVHVNRTFREFRDARLAEVERGTVRLRDFAGLAVLADAVLPMAPASARPQ